ncbi:MAG: carotenoid oxygenase family protein [Pseudomonadota bacterium]
MDRRHFLSSGVAFGALALASGSALADAATYRRFHAALKRDPKLVVFADTVAENAGEAVVKGRIPADLEGVFFRNGPGRFELGGERYHHWFDGDGFAQRWQVSGAKVSHRGRFVQTQKFVDESSAGQFLYPAFGTWIDRRAVKTNDTLNAANTNLVPFGGRLYALWEGGSATELDPQSLATLGVKTWSDELKSMPFSAHPKMDPDGGMWNFGALPGSDKLVIYRLGANGQMQSTSVVDVPQLAMVHDFVVSAGHLIFLIPPYDLMRGEQKSFADMHQWAGSGAKARALRAVVVAKATMQVRQVFELPPHMVFHFGNAWDDGDTTRFDVVLHQGDALMEVGHLMQGERPRNIASRSFAAQVTLDYAKKQANVARLLGPSEFPRVMPQVVSVRHRKLALLSSSPRNRDAVLDTVNLVDTASGNNDSYRFDAGWVVEEHVLVPRANAVSETDGYLVGVAQDTKLAHTVMTVFDAAHVKDGPLALARLPYRTPHCFHGNFLKS